MPSFVEIGQPVLEKTIFEGFLPYMGMAAILVMRPELQCIYIYLDSPFLQMSDIKPSFDWLSRFREEDV